MDVVDGGGRALGEAGGFKDEDGALTSGGSTQVILWSFQFRRSYGMLPDSTTDESHTLHVTRFTVNSFAWASFTSCSFRSASWTRLLGASL